MKGAVRLGILGVLAAVALGAAPASATVPPGYSMRAIGDSVTSGFGYCGTNDAECGAGPGQVGPPWRMLTMCLQGGWDNRCSSNRGNERGVGSTVAWPARVAHHHGITDFANHAFQGSTPATWDRGGELHGWLQHVLAAQPRVVTMTLGANPLLKEFSQGDFLICGLALDDDRLRQCVRLAMVRYGTVEHLESVYRQVLAASPRTHLVVSLYHHPVPFPAYALRHKVDVIINQINATIRGVVGNVSASYPGRVSLIAPDHSPWPLRHQCGAVQAAAGAEFLFSLGFRGMNPLHASTPWVLDNDTCTHPSASGYEQFAHALGRVLPHGLQRRGEVRPDDEDDGTLEVKLDYAALEIGHEHPKLRIHLNRDARLEIHTRRDRCLEESAIAAAEGEPVTCDAGVHAADHRLELDGHAGWQTVELPVMEGYFEIVVEARSADGQVTTATAQIVQRTKQHLMGDFEDTPIADERRRGPKKR